MFTNDAGFIARYYSNTLIEHTEENTVPLSITGGHHVSILRGCGICQP